MTGIVSLRRVLAVPRTWVRAAQELPAVHRALRDTGAGSPADGELRAALERAGLEPTPERLALMRRLRDGRNRPPAPS